MLHPISRSLADSSCGGPRRALLVPRDRKFESSGESPANPRSLSTPRASVARWWDREFESAFLQRRVSSELANADSGLLGRHDRMTRTPNTFAAHRLMWLAGEAGNPTPLADKLFTA